MDHLPSFGRSVPIRVPYLYTEMFDGGSFIEYPSRQGWTVKQFMRGDMMGRDPEELAAFLQAWAYFGLLSSVLGPAIAAFDLYDFVESDEQGRKVTTKHLPSHLFRWQQWESSRTPQQRRDRFDFIKDHFELLQRLIPRVYSYDTGFSQASSAAWPGPPEVLLSVVVLADTLTWAASQVLGRRFNIDWGTSPLLIARMREAGWCPSATATLLKGQQLQLLYSASTIGSPTKILDHVGRNCTENVCHFEQLVEAEYRSMHWGGCPGCISIGPAMENVKDIIRNGGTPVIAYHRTSTGISMDAVRASPNVPYVALSHVWSHGLGNPHKNALPVCQVKRLQALVDEVAPLSRQQGAVPRRWWCDTICVPVRGADDDLRRKAIGDMRGIYQHALKVLALDLDLLRNPCHTSVIELYVWLKLCTWMRRLWTLQEAVLPQEVHIRFLDGTMTLQSIAKSVHQEQLKEQRVIYHRCSQLSGTYFAPFLTRTEGDTLTRFKSTWKQLQWRATSHKSDETVCLATILGLDTMLILKVPVEDQEQRMICLLRMMGKFSLLLPFQPPPRLQTFGFRWAPASFLNCFRNVATDPFRVMDGSAALGSNNEGLEFCSSGLIFQKCVDPNTIRQASFHIVVEGQSSPSHSIGYRWIADRDTPITGSTPVIEEPAIVYLATDLETNPAVLVNILETDPQSKCFKAAYLCVVFVAPVSKMPDGSVRPGVIHHVTARDSTQRWILY